ncbi:class I SAM-dependent methyltransferase [Paenibacillus puerhi]|uniref:class I SAM-dependent methyltransferase n=1 Tax=Paenibacillus puerhi TaxID=2692622 RepID=UPI001357129B|nr:class I SAM-dependent methyltransferase [Paenibacillus puerhi]
MLKYNNEINLTSQNSVSLIIKNIEPGSTVLEFGPATGYMTRYLKEELNCKVYCVEIDAASAEIASEFCEIMVVADLDEMKWKNSFENIIFDHIVFADVLEHLRKPIDVLKEATSLLNKEGTIITSIPNIGHNAIIMELMQGRFNYQSLGLLDDTHVHFFTKNSIIEMFRSAKLYPIRWLTTFLTPEQTEFNQNYATFPEPIQVYLKNNEDGHVYQYITVTKKGTEEDFERWYKTEAKECDYNHSEFLQFFWEGKDGYSESESLKVPLRQTLDYQSFEFVIPVGSQRKVRFDPINIPAFVYINKMQLLNNGTGELFLDLRDHHWVEEGDFRDIIVFRRPEGILLLASEDAQIYIKDIPSDLNNILVKIELKIEKQLSTENANYLYGDYKKKFDEISKLRVKYEENLTIVEELNKNSVFLRNELTNREQQVLQLVEELERVNLHVSQLVEELERVNLHVPQLAVELENRTLHVTQLETELENTISLVRNKESEIKNLHLDYSIKISGKENEINRLENELINVINESKNNILELQKLSSERDSLVVKLQQQQGIYNEITSSISWRITAPLRWLRRIFRL